MAYHSVPYNPAPPLYPTYPSSGQPPPPSRGVGPNYGTIPVPMAPGPGNVYDATIGAPTVEYPSYAPPTGPAPGNLGGYRAPPIGGTPPAVRPDVVPPTRLPTGPMPPVAPGGPPMPGPMPGKLPPDVQPIPGYPGWVRTPQGIVYIGTDIYPPAWGTQYEGNVYGVSTPSLFEWALARAQQLVPAPGRG